MCALWGTTADEPTGMLVGMAATAKASAVGRRHARPRAWRVLVALTVLVLTSVAAPTAGAQGHGTGGGRSHAHQPKPTPKPVKVKRFGVDFRLSKGEYDSHLFHLSDTGCSSKTTEEDKFFFDALYMLQLPPGKSPPSLDLIDLEPSSWAWSYLVEETGCGGEAESEGPESCDATEGFKVEPPPTDGPEATVRQGSLRLALQATSGIVIEEAHGSSRCEGKLGFSLFDPAGALFMPQMLSAQVSVPLAVLTKAPKPRRGKSEPDLWTKRDIHLANPDRPPLDCSPEAAGDTCDQHVQWEGSVRIFRMK